MAAPYVRQTRGSFTALIGSTAVVAGDMLYFDGTDWELADASDNTKFAEAIAANSYASGETGVVCTSGIIVDTDAPFTQGDTQYLSPTAGAITTTRPGASVTGELTQVVGFSLSTTEVNTRIAIPHEETIYVDLPYALTNAAVTADADWAGLSMLTDNDGAQGTGVMPSNTVALKFAFLWNYNEDVLATGGYAIDVSSAHNDESGTGTTDGITDTAIGVTTADDLVRSDVSAAFNAAGLVDSGVHFGLQVQKKSETAADDYRFHGVELVLMVV